MKIDVVVGGQYGSEAKGHVTQRLIDRMLPNPQHSSLTQVTRPSRIANIRVAGPNAGHTAHTHDGIAIPFRQLPVGSLRPGVACIIAAGSEIDPSVLLREINDAMRYAQFDPQRLWVDHSATILEPGHARQEAGMHESMGSTGKGIGAARAARIMRTAKTVWDDISLVNELERLGANVVDTQMLLRLGMFDNVVIEGTQGYALGLHAGYYPYCTSSDCRAIDFLAMAGLNPWQGDDRLEVWVVARMFPIRVAGNSGPMLDETTWEALGLPEERTTVTKKVRRVGAWDEDLVKNAVAANGGAPVVSLALTMMDQKFPDLAGVTTTDKLVDHPNALAFIADVEAYAMAPVRLATTGPNTGVWM